LRFLEPVPPAGVRLGCLFAALALAGEARADDDLSAGATLRAATTGRGDRDLVVVGTIRRASTTLSLGYGQSAGPGAAERHALLASFAQEIAEVCDDAVELELDTRLAPDQAAVARREIETWARWSGLGAGFHFRTTDAATANLVAMGATLEASRKLGSFTAGAGASISDLALRAPRATDPWSRFSRRTLDFPERWSVSATLGAREGALAAELSATVASPPGAPLTQQVELKVEAKILRAVVSAKAGFLTLPAGPAPLLGAEVRVEP